jgi:hypothetical protein
MNEDMEGIKRKIMHPNAEEFTISRVPKDVIAEFKKLAHEQYVGDYGMLLKGLVDNNKIEERFASILSILGEHETRLKNLEQKPTEKIIAKTISGREVKIEKKEE